MWSLCATSTARRSRSFTRVTRESCGSPKKISDCAKLTFFNGRDSLRRVPDIKAATKRGPPGRHHRDRLPAARVVFHDSETGRGNQREHSAPARGGDGVKLRLGKEMSDAVTVALREPVLTGRQKFLREVIRQNFVLQVPKNAETPNPKTDHE